MRDQARKRHSGIPGLWTQELDAVRWSLDAGLWTRDTGLWTLDSGPDFLLNVSALST